MLSVCSTDADGSERGGGHQQADRGVGVSVLQGPPAVHGGRTEGRAHRPLQDPQLPRRAEEQQRTGQYSSNSLYPNPLLSVHALLYLSLFVADAVLLFYPCWSVKSMNPKFKHQGLDPVEVALIKRQFCLF